MSDVSQGPGWWQASDQKWYPPAASTLPPPPMSEPISAKGVNGTVSFDGKVVTVSHNSLMGRMTAGKGEKRIPVKSIAAVEWKAPGMGVRGFMRLTIPGGIEKSSRVGRRGTDAAKDENSVLFSKGQTNEFQRIRDAIEAAIS